MFDIFTVTPLDVVKIRLQTQQKAMLSNRCFLYCNGLMDHLCPCTNGKLPEWIKRNGKFNGTVVRNDWIILYRDLTINALAICRPLSFRMLY